MIRKLKPVIILLIHILLLQKVCGQASLTMTDYLRQKLIKYTDTVPREEIYVHTDRNEYISGEDIWFNIYLIDRQSQKPSPSKIAYFELLNPENRPIVQKKIWLDNGFGPGQIILPDTLSTGVYTIRAYTNWMKNFLPYNCFTKDIRIYNSFSNKVFKGKKSTDNKFKETSNPVYFTPLENTGITLKVNNLNPDVLDIVVETNEKYRSENNNLLYLFIQTNGLIDRASTEKIAEDQTLISIPKKQLAAGINQITVFNLKGQPVGAKYIYTPLKIIPAIVVISPDSSGLRKKISVELGPTNGKPDDYNNSNFSISVSPLTNNSSIPGIDDYLIFGTEFGFKPQSVFKDKKVSEISPDVIDSLLGNIKSNWINWNVIMDGEQPVFKYQIEKEDHFLIGKLFSSDQKAGVPDRFVLMSTPGKTAAFQYAKTDEDGNFSFKIHIDEKVKDLIILPDIIVKNQSVNIESSFSDQYLKYTVSVDSANSMIPGYISAWSVNHQVRKIYGTSDIGKTLTPVISVPKIRRFYGKPDIELKMKDYITLPVMQEVFFELLAGISLKNKKSGYEMTVANPENNKPYESPPGLFIDGVAVKDASLIAGLDPEAVETIDVVKEKYFVGDYQFYGIVNVITKTANFSNLALPDYSIRLPYRVLDPVAPFMSPDYSSSDLKKSRVPDFRNTLYWNPSVKPDKTGKAHIEFWTSDFISDFEVNIQGITQDGHTFSIKKIIKVK
jgi:hypothetical protein